MKKDWVHDFISCSVSWVTSPGAGQFSAFCMFLLAHFFPVFQTGFNKNSKQSTKGRAEAHYCSQRGKLALCSIRPLSFLLPNQVFYLARRYHISMAIKFASVNSNKHMVACLTWCKPVPQTGVKAIWSSQWKPGRKKNTEALFCVMALVRNEFFPNELEKYIHACIYDVCMDPWKCRLAPFGSSSHPQWLMVRGFQCKHGEVDRVRTTVWTVMSISLSSVLSGFVLAVWWLAWPYLLHSTLPKHLYPRQHWCRLHLHLFCKTH